MPGTPTDRLRSPARHEALRRERATAAPFRDRFEWRIVGTFAAFAAAWVAVIILGVRGDIPLVVGTLLSTVIATSFYMPLHEATHGNIWGAERRWRRGESLIGVLCAIPLASTSFASHRILHMRHHAHTNDPIKDPDRFIAGSPTALVVKLLGILVTYPLQPLVLLVPPSLLPVGLRGSYRFGSTDPAIRRSTNRHWLFWAGVHAVLLVLVAVGLGWEALMLWYLPARLASVWLAFMFAWFPHHPELGPGRYVDTRIAAFPGSRYLARGHDHHAIHHLFPRVPHTRLRALWVAMGEELIAKGVRAEGTAVYAVGPIRW